MRRALTVSTLCAAILMAGCASTAWMLKQPGEEYSQGNYVFGTVMLVCLPVMVPIFMMADAFEVLGVTEEDVAVVAQAGQDYVTMRAAQEQQAEAQAQAQRLAAMQAQQAQQQQQQRPAAPQPAPQQVASAAPSRLDGIPAHECVSFHSSGGTGFNGFRNKCPYKVEISWCNHPAYAGSDPPHRCSENSFAAMTAPAHGVGYGHVSPNVSFFACKAPDNPHQTTYDPAAQRIRGYCYNWARNDKR